MTIEVEMKPTRRSDRTPPRGDAPAGPGDASATVAAPFGPILASGLRILAIALGCALAVGLVVVAVAALVSGATAAAVALIGTALTVLVFAFGSFIVHVAAAIMPSAALLVALTTYVTQLVAVFAIFIVLTRDGGAADGPQRGWLAAAVIACTLAWMAVQVVSTSRQRIPLYDLPESGPADGAVTPGREGER